MTQAYQALCLALLLLGAGCATGTSVPPTPWPEPSPEAELRLSGIFGLDDKTAVVGGDFSGSGATVHSTMHITEDGGASWRPMGPAVPSSTIFSIYFLDRRRGWAAGAHTTESTCEPFVLKTTDGGESWSRSEIPVASLFGPLGTPQSIEFITPRYGVVCVHVYTNAEDVRAFFLTKDGGKTWTFSHGRSSQSRIANNELSITPGGFAWTISEQTVQVSSDLGQNWRKTASQPGAESRPALRRAQTPEE